MNLFIKWWQNNPRYQPTPIRRPVELCLCVGMHHGCLATVANPILRCVTERHIIYRFDVWPLPIPINDSFDVSCVLRPLLAGRSMGIKYAKVSLGCARPPSVVPALIIVIILWTYSSPLCLLLVRSISSPQQSQHSHAHTSALRLFYNSWRLLIFCLIIPLKVFLCAPLLCRHNYSPNDDKTFRKKKKKRKDSVSLVSPHFRCKCRRSLLLMSLSLTPRPPQQTTNDIMLCEAIPKFGGTLFCPGQTYTQWKQSTRLLHRLYSFPAK